MPPKAKQCKVCKDKDFKYTCPQCRIVYCSMLCYKTHKESSCVTTTTETIKSQPDENLTAGSTVESSEEAIFPDAPVLRPLTSLKWPYVPDESAFPDPLKRDDPKALQLHQYEAIATSPAVREILSKNKNLPALLTSIDKLRGPDRERALERALGVAPPDISNQLYPEVSEDVLSLRELAEAIESAIRGENQFALGLNWGE